MLFAGTQTMTSYNHSKRRFVQHVSERCKEREREIVGTDFPAFLLDNGVAANVRGTVCQSNPIKLNVDAEIEFMNKDHQGDITETYLALLDLVDQNGFDPSNEDVYFIPESALRNDEFVKRKPSDGHYLLTIDLSTFPAKRWRNNWSALFPSEDDGVQRCSEEGNPGFENNEASISNLQRIARDCVENVSD